MALHSGKLAEITEGHYLHYTQNWPIDYLLTDSRHSIPSTNALFFAIIGKNHNGHEFLYELYQKGMRQFVVQDEQAAMDLALVDANVFVVKNVVASLQHIAAWHRRQFDLKTIGITGSNGKTIVKEWLYQLLSPSWRVIKSPKSYNSQIGVPLSVWQIKAEHQIGLFEAGISHAGEMGNLADIILPDLGIFTNIGPAHSEGFTSLEEKVEEKAKLFEHATKIIYHKKYKSVEAVLERVFPQGKLLSWSFDEGATIQVNVIKQRGRSEVALVGQEGPHFTEATFQLPFSDDASVENILHCIVMALYLGLEPTAIQERIGYLSTVQMRLELKAGRNDCYVIDDTYNNDPEGLRIALNFMQQQAVQKNKVVILSDMLETGIDSDILYKSLSRLLREKQIDLLLGVGAEISSHAECFPPNSLFFPDTNALLSQLASLHLQESLILVKGARVFRFERVVQMLEQKIHRTVLEVNLNALTHNLNVFRQMLKPETKMMVMVKAFAYGAGSHEVAHLLQYNKVDYLAVAYTDEGVELREHNVEIPIMVMNPTPDEFDKLVKNKLEAEIYSFKLLDALVAYLETAHLAPQDPYHIHLAIDTGMHRLGFEEADIDRVIGVLKTFPGIKVASVFSHLVGADDAQHDEFSARQAALFLRIANKIETQIGYSFLKHLLNSAGITRLGQYHFDMVRLGIGLYGIEAEGHPIQHKLQTVGTLKTLVSQIHAVKEGDSIGYGRKGKAFKDSQIATIAIGYADGFSRAFSNGVGKAWIKGHLVPIIGNVCMDMTMLDVTGFDILEGDEVVLFGKELPVQELSRAINTIPYEILTNVSERVKRVFYLD